MLGLSCSTQDLPSSSQHAGTLVVGGTWDLVPWPGIESQVSALGAWSISHWATWEVPAFSILEILLFGMFLGQRIWPGSSSISSGCSPGCLLSRFSRVQLFMTPWTAARQAPLPMGFPRQEYWSGLPFPPPGDLPDPESEWFRPIGHEGFCLDPGIQPASFASPALAGGFFTKTWPEAPGSSPGGRSKHRYTSPPCPTGDRGKHRYTSPPSPTPAAALRLGWGCRYSDQISCSVVSDSLRPHELQHTRLPCPSPTPGIHPNSCPSSQWCHPAISSSVIPFSSCPQSHPASESFPKSQLFAWGGQSIGVSALASVLPKNTQDWSPLEWTGWISWQSKGLSRLDLTKRWQKQSNDSINYNDPLPTSIE